ncbi:MAG: hypothetical protein OEM97_02340 [Acidimicrobiia bacterium]|nr:hypothetical protein [Acidimicrobiia bacterium]
MDQSLRRTSGLILWTTLGALPDFGLALLSTAQADGTKLARTAVAVTVAGVPAGAVFGSSRSNSLP